MRTVVRATVAELAAMAETEVHRHKPRTPQRRAAAALWAALVTSATVSGALSALPAFTAPETATAAAGLLHRLAATAATAMKEGSSS